MTATAESSFASSTNRWPRLVNILLVAVLAHLLGLATLKLLPADARVDTSIDTDVASVRGESSDPIGLGLEIAAAHLFGDATTPAAPVERREPAVETRLNLQLAGVLAYDPPERAIAIISSGSSEQSAYGVGDRITGQTRLKEVHPDHVLLDNNGREEILRLPEDAAPLGMREIPTVTAQMPDEAATTSDPDVGQPVELPASPGALRDTLARNPSLLGRVVAAEPYQENGQLRGYRIMPKQNPEILEAQGILSGDVITSVNNIQLNSQRQGIRALRNAVRADSLDVTVLRDGVEVPISISLAQ